MYTVIHVNNLTMIPIDFILIVTMARLCLGLERSKFL